MGARTTSVSIDNGGGKQASPAGAALAGRAQRQVRPGARRCVSVTFQIARGCDAETESVCDAQLIRGRAANSSRKLRSGILGKTWTPAAGRSLALSGSGGLDERWRGARAVFR